MLICMWWLNSTRSLWVCWHCLSSHIGWRVGKRTDWSQCEMKNCSGMSCWNSPWTLWRLCKQHCKQLSIRFWPSACKGKPTIKTGCKTRENSSTECHKSPERRNSSSSVRANPQCRYNGRGFCSLLCKVSPWVSQHGREAVPGQAGHNSAQGQTGRCLPDQHVFLKSPPVLDEPCLGPHRGWVSSGQGSDLNGVGETRCSTCILVTSALNKGAKPLSKTKANKKSGWWKSPCVWKTRYWPSRAGSKNCS